MSSNSTSPSGALVRSNWSPNPGIQLVQASVEFQAGSDLATVQTDHLVHPTVQVDHPSAARLLVQSIDVLGDQFAQIAGLLQCGQRQVAPVRDGGAHPLPAEMTSGPIPLLCDRPGAEVCDGHRRTHRRTGSAVVGYTGIGRHAGAGQRNDRPAREHVDSSGEGPLVGNPRWRNPRVRMVDGTGHRHLPSLRCRDFIDTDSRYTRQSRVRFRRAEERCTMRSNIHPDYHEVVFRDSSTGDEFLTRSTATSSTTVQVAGWAGFDRPQRSAHRGRRDERLPPVLDRQRPRGRHAGPGAEVQPALWKARSLTAPRRG